MSDKKPKDIVEQISSIDDEVALKLLCRLAGSTKAFADTSGIPYHKINNIIQGKQCIRQEMLLSFYRDTLTDEFKQTLENTYLLVTALAELGIIKPGPGLTEMDEFETKVFDLTHEGGEASLGRDNTLKGKQTHDEPKPEPKPEPQGNFTFRSKKPVDRTPSSAYNESIVDDLIVGESIPNPPAMTGDILGDVKTGGTVHENVIGDVFEVGLRNIPDKFDSDNKRF